MSDIINSKDGKLTTTSKIVADVFEKPHRDVTKAILSLDCSDEFSMRNFSQSEYTTERGKTYKCYNITKDGFYYLCMGFNGSKAAKWKEAFIDTFNRMERGLINADAEMTKLSKQGDNLKALGREWSAFGNKIKSEKRKHTEAVDILMDKIQIKLDLK